MSALELDEIQGLVLSGYGQRPLATFHVFRIDDPVRARGWLRRIRVQFADFFVQHDKLANEVINVAFTHEGLRVLGLPEEALAGFVTPFREGLSAPHRARQLGDDGESAPHKWAWGGPDTGAHGVVFAYGGEHEALDFPFLDGSGLSCTRTLPSSRVPQAKRDRKEHFGYRDGISNPVVAGLPHAKHDVIAAGEVVLGYANAYEQVPLTPRMRAELDPQELLPRADDDRTLRDFGKNGSYVVFRQMAQDVEAFHRFTAEAGRAIGESEDWVGSRLVGRWKDGTPITLSPNEDHVPHETNDFRYHPHDPAGEKCPLGAHIRRTNPRDTTLPVPYDPALCGEGRRPLDTDDHHRIVRRGRSYTIGEERGLHFICVNANLRRQFEFVQSQWVNNPSFAGMSGNPDPLIGNRAARDFVIQGTTDRPARTLQGVPRLTEVRGGAYLFMPSRRALAYLADLPIPSIERIEPGETEAAKADAALHRDKIEKAFAVSKRATRAFHVKTHGICKAKLVVRDDLPIAFQHGVFLPGATYDAWIRFSNSAFTPAPDATRDVHGLAIKLLGVHGERAAPFERNTQDFLLIDAPYLMVGDIFSAVAFDGAQIRGGLGFIAHLATHPGELLRLYHMLNAPKHPLERVYSSVAPFRLGPHVVRWAARRASPLVSAGEGPDRLRAAIAAQLASGDFRIELCVEMRGESPHRPIDDGSVDWRGTLERIADLEISAEGFGTAEQEALGEKMSFNPWNALEAHRPLGNLNRARKIVYRAIYEWRTRLNGLEPFEPG